MTYENTFDHLEQSKNRTRATHVFSLKKPPRSNRGRIDGSIIAMEADVVGANADMT